MKRVLLAGLCALSVTGCAGTSVDRAVLSAEPSTEQGASAIAFWSGVSAATAGTFESEKYTELEDMAKSSTAVVVGRVLQTFPTRMVGEFEIEAPDSRIQLYGAEVEVLEVLSGTLAPRDRASSIVTVEAIHPFPQTPTAEASVLFLRHKTYNNPAKKSGPTPPGEDRYYRLVESQGVLVNDQGRAASPSARSGKAEGPAPIAEEIARKGLTFDQMKEEVRRAGRS